MLCVDCVRARAYSVALFLLLPHRQRPKPGSQSLFAQACTHAGVRRTHEHRLCLRMYTPVSAKMPPHPRLAQHRNRKPHPRRTLKPAPSVVPPSSPSSHHKTHRAFVVRTPNAVRCCLPGTTVPPPLLTPPSASMSAPSPRPLAITPPSNGAAPSVVDAPLVPPPPARRLSRWLLQDMTRPSSPPEAKRVPSALKAHAVTAPEWPLRV